MRSIYLRPTTAALAAILALALGASAIPPVAAAEGDRFAMRGAGIALELPEQEPYKAGFGMLLQVAREAGETIHFQVRKGLVVINDEGSPVRYRMVSDTWQATLVKPAEKFVASGKVVDRAEETYEVTLQGDLRRSLDRGIILTVTGKFAGAGQNYDLFFIALLSPLHARS